MSRRKQARPIRHLDEAEDGLNPSTAAPATATPALPNGESSCSVSEDEGGGAESGGGPQDGSESGQERSCGRCREDFPDLTSYLAHKVTCKRTEEDEEMSSEEEEMEEEKQGLRRRRLQDAENNNGALRHSQDKEEYDEFDEKSMASVLNLAPLLNLTPGAPPNPAAMAAMAAAAAAIPGAASLFPGLGGSTVTLEALQNTKVAVAQFAATALANNANNPAALQELAVLQSTLYTLQHQQMLQLNLIQQLQQQLQIGNRGSKEGSPVSPASIPRIQHDDILTPPSPPISIPSSLPLSSANIPLHPPPPSHIHHPMEQRPLEAARHMEPRHIESRHERTPSIERQQHHQQQQQQQQQQGTALPATVLKQPQVTAALHTPRLAIGVEPLPPTKPTPSSTPRPHSPPASTPSNTPTLAAPPHSSIPPHPLHHQTGGGVTGCSISASLAASIITNTDPLPSSDEPNSLEMLQRRAQEVLDSASQGLLAGNLADELAFRGGCGKGGSGKGDGKRGNEPFFKHRCRYCGKVFGSDSALQIHIRSHTVRGNTTCNICYKTFACHSALEIHYRSHTKERPFKCTVCDRGFSTKGNMKQHMLTHKIRDMPQNFFDAAQRQQGPIHSPLGGGPSPQSKTVSPLPLLPPPPQQHCSNSNSEDATSIPGDERPPLTPTPEPPRSGTRSPEIGLKRSPPDGDSLLPIPKRPPGLPKHLCHVCNKNFSSSSALQIHMRTHTGDKPFKCTVCQKAFTTKGNLKVHMGTHMWNNGASRRGRRMSLDLPPIPMTPKDSEFLQRRPDLFYPYLPAPFLNGMQQKLNEISVIQSSANSTGGLPSSPPSKFGPPPPLGFAGLGLGYDKPLGLTIGTDLSRSGSPSPDSKAPSSPLSLVRHASPPNMWDLHYRRLSPPERNGASSPPAQSMTPSPPSNQVQHPPPGSTPPQQLTTQRGESLVA